MLLHISSSKNEKFKHFKALKTKKYRTQTNSFTVEGIKSVHDALLSDALIESVILSEEFYKTEALTVADNINVYVISDEIFPALSNTETPQGVIAVIKRREKELKLDTSKAYIFCDHVQDPGNLGTIIRTADAAGFGGVILSEDCVEPYNPKTVRASMGSFFNIDLFENVTPDMLSSFKDNGYKIICGVLSHDTVDYTEPDYTKPVIVVVGNEANGITDEVIAVSDVNIKIPIDGKAESLNAAVAAAVIMYEVNRQRRNYNLLGR